MIEIDIYCPKCGEPWDMDTLHDVAGERYGVSYYLDGKSIYDVNVQHNPFYNSEEYQKYYTKVSEDFRRIGCKALSPEYGNMEHCRPKKKNEKNSAWGLTRAEKAAALYEISGDDLDGVAASLDDVF